MIIILRVECVYGRFFEDECVRFIEIDESASLNDLHIAIHDSVDFDWDHPFEFFAGRHHRNRKMLITEAKDITYDGEGPLYELTLRQIYPLPKGLRLIYHFDFGDDWYFEILKSRKKPVPPEKGVLYPRVVERIGPDPPQYGE